MPEGARRFEERSYQELGVEPEELEDYIGEAVIRVSELQAEKARLEGEGGSKKELADLNREIRSLQKLIRDNEEAFRQADLRRQETAAKAKQAELIAKTKAAVARAKIGRVAKKEAAPEERTDAEMAKQAELIERTKAAVKTKTLIERTKAAVAKKMAADKEARDMGEAERAAAEFRARLEARKQAREAAEKALMNQVVAAMEAGPATEAREEAAPPENLPVAEATPERPSYGDILDKAKIYKGLTKKGREGMMDIITRAAADTHGALQRGEAVAPEKYGPRMKRERAMLDEQYPGWTREDFRSLLNRIERDEAFDKDIRAVATKQLVEEPAARIDALRERVRKLKEEAKTERERIGTMVGDTEAEQRFFEQGGKPEELAKREQATERYPELPPEEAVAEMAKIEAKSARDFENEQDFAAAFADAVRNDPAHRINPDAATEYAAQYWKLLQKDNQRLAEAMKPQPKVGFFRRIFGGAPKPKQVMTPQEIVQFQRMDKTVREVMERPSTSLRSIRVGGRTASRGPGAPTTMGRPPR